MKIEQFEVKNNGLQKYIDYYYLLSTVGDKENTTYLAFPSGRSPLGFFKNALFSELSENIKVYFSPNDSLTVSLVGNFLKPLKIIFEPNIVEFSIVFKPLGIQFFIGDNLGEAMRKNVSETNYFDDLIPVARRIIEGFDAFAEFEARMAAKFSSNRQLETLESVISRFQEAEQQMTEQQISNELNISPKQIFRLFKNHLGLNPSQYRHLLRFRNAMESSLQNLNQNLTEIGLTAGYYDQPHFIREFRKLTNQAPREFLGKIPLETKNKIVWQFSPKMSDPYNQ